MFVFGSLEVNAAQTLDTCLFIRFILAYINSMRSFTDVLTPRFCILCKKMDKSCLSFCILAANVCFAIIAQSGISTHSTYTPATSTKTDKITKLHGAAASFRLGRFYYVFLPQDLSLAPPLVPHFGW